MYHPDFLTQTKEIRDGPRKERKQNESFSTTFFFLQCLLLQKKRSCIYSVSCIIYSGNALGIQICGCRLFRCVDPRPWGISEEEEGIHAIWSYKKRSYIYLRNTKCQEISKELFLETPLPKKRAKFFGGFLSQPPNWVRRESFIGKKAKKACKQ